MNIPETFTLPHIRLRRPRLSDAEAIFDYAGDPEVAHYADWPVRTSIEPLIESLRQKPQQWEAGEEYYWVITLPDEDRAIGGVACVINGHSVSFGYLVNRRYWGQGIATAAAGTIVEWLFTLPQIWRVWATCDVENIGSVRVLEKVGLTREGVLRRWAIRPNLSAEPRDAYIYSRIRDD